MSGTPPLIRGYEVVIGIETHAQLRTNSKIFSGASTAFGAAPNTQACAVDLALPGTLPVMNREAVALAIRFGLAVGAKVAPLSIFARKNYFYPDLPKGYQISQYEIPVVQGGHLACRVGEVEKTVNLTRAHLEEDAGKSLHEDYHGQSGIDLNRAGTPLLEIVTEPDMRSAAEAVEYARALHALVVWLDICDGNMQEGSFRCDANVSVRRPGAAFGTRREIKNLNSFRFMQQAIDFEVNWQIDQIEDGLKIEQATVLFNPDTGETRSMRSKEDAHDYRYFPDPDLPPLVIAPEWVEQVRATMPELPRAMAERFAREDGLPAYDAAMMTQSLGFARFYEAAKAAGAPAKLVANWLMGEVSKRLNAEGRGIEAAPVNAATLAALIGRISDGTISNNAARQVFDALWSGAAGDVDAVIDAKGLKQMNDSGALEKIIDEVIAANAEERRGVPRRQGQGLQCAGGPGDEGQPGQGQPGAGERAAEEKAGLGFDEELAAQFAAADLQHRLALLRRQRRLQLLVHVQRLAGRWHAGQVHLHVTQRDLHPLGREAGLELGLLGRAQVGHRRRLRRRSEQQRHAQQRLHRGTAPRCAVFWTMGMSAGSGGAPMVPGCAPAHSLRRCSSSASNRRLMRTSSASWLAMAERWASTEVSLMASCCCSLGGSARPLKNSASSSSGLRSLLNSSSRDSEFFIATRTVSSASSRDLRCAASLGKRLRRLRSRRTASACAARTSAARASMASRSARSSAVSVGGITWRSEPSRLSWRCSLAMHSLIGRSDVSRRPLSSTQVKICCLGPSFTWARATPEFSPSARPSQAAAHGHAAR